jgi:hypothetical protein
MRRIYYDTEFNEQPGSIDLISIGMVDDDGNELYEISREFSLARAMEDEWLRDNVISKLPAWTLKPRNLRATIAKRVLEFCRPTEEPIELIGYYSAYDHVSLCWLFGRMIDLPEGMPMFTTDIKQIANSLGNPELPEQKEGHHDALADAKWNREAYNFLMNYHPQTETRHENYPRF